MQINSLSRDMRTLYHESWEPRASTGHWRLPELFSYWKSVLIITYMDPTLQHKFQIHRTAWKSKSADFEQTSISHDAKHNPTMIGKARWHNSKFDSNWRRMKLIDYIGALLPNHRPDQYEILSMQYATNILISDISRVLPHNCLGRHQLVPRQWCWNAKSWCGCWIGSSRTHRW